MPGLPDIALLVGRFVSILVQGASIPGRIGERGASRLDAPPFGRFADGAPLLIGAHVVLPSMRCTAAS